RRSTGSEPARSHLSRGAMAFARAGASSALIDTLVQLRTSATNREEQLAIETEVLAARIWAPHDAIDVDAVRTRVEESAAVLPTASARLLTVLALGLVIAGRPDEA